MANLTLFSQILQIIDKQGFNSAIKKHQSDKHSKGLSTWNQVVSMLFCHFSGANSLREITNGLKATGENLHQVGVSKAPARSTLAYANQNRSVAVFIELFHVILDQLQTQLKGSITRKPLSLRIKRKMFILDSTQIQLCLSVFDWARYRTTKGATKVHTMLDYDGCLPVFLAVTDGKKADVKFAPFMPIPAGSVVVADRGYFDFSLFGQWEDNNITFVTRIKSNITYEIVQIRSLPENAPNIHEDTEIRCTGLSATKNYNKTLRRVVAKDPVSGVLFEFVTNQMSWTADIVADIYRERWLIEAFFKEIKQGLKIKSFVGTSANAVMIQIWTAFMTILLLKFMRIKSKAQWCASNLLAFLRMNIFTITSLRRWLNDPFKPPRIIENPQIPLFSTSLLST